MALKIKDMTLREKIGQTVIFRHDLLKDITDIEGYFSNNPIGSTWPMDHDKEVYRLFETQMGNPELKGYKDDMYINHINIINKYLRIPVIPAVDASNGIVPTKFEGHAELPTSANLGATKNPDFAYRYAKVLGEDLRSIGFRWLWSPVADNAGVFTGTRVMSCDFENNKELLPAFIRGMQEAGVATGTKHFPGPDPYDRRDSHFCTSRNGLDFDTWMKTQGREFQVCIDAGVDSVMVGHRTFRAVDDTRVNGALLPSTLSYKVVTELLKGKMGFKGVVLTDDCDMKALTAIYPQDKLYVEILRAGVDVVLGPTRLDYIDIVEKAVLNGELPESRIDDACSRVLKMKEKYGLLEHRELPHPTEEERDAIREKIHTLSREISEKSLTMTANRIVFVPINNKKIKKVKIVYIGYSDQCYDNLQYAVKEFERHGAQCDVQNGFKAEDNNYLEQYDMIVYATYIGHFAPAGAQAFVEDKSAMMRQIMTACVEKSVGVSFGNPDIFFNYFTAVPTFVNCYSYTPENMESFVKGLYGEITFTDYSPYPLNPITRTNDVYE